MIQGMDTLLAGTPQPGVEELREFLIALVGGPSAEGRLVGQQILQPKAQRVFRIGFELKSGAKSFVIKRLRPDIGRRNELVATRWLPAIGLDGAGPPLLGVAAARSGECVWHIYEDLGAWELPVRRPDRERVQAAVELIAHLHTRFASHALLGGGRLHGGDLGIHFYQSNVRDATYALEAWRPSTPNAPVLRSTAEGGQASTSHLRDRLLERLYRLSDEL